MNFRCGILAMALAVGCPGQFEAAAPAAQPMQQAAAIADIPFDPPLRTKIRYRWERRLQQGARTELLWSVYEYRFDAADSGYRLTLTPVSWGTNETDPAKLSFAKRLDELIRRPFSLRLDEDGQIEAFEDADRYWQEIFGLLDQEGRDNPALRAAMQDVVAMYRRMPAEVRQSMLIKEILPVVEFGNTQTEVGKPLVASLEGQSPFGGSISREMTITLNKVGESSAYLTTTSTVPRAELEKMMQAMLTQLTSLPADKRAEAEKEVAALREFRHDTTADYEVSLADGLLVKYRSTETIEVGDRDRMERRVTTRTISRLD